MKKSGEFQRQVAAASERAASWPQWMREVATPVAPPKTQTSAERPKATPRS